MTTELSASTAKIYQFPPRGRYASGRVEQSKAEPVSEVAFGSWYHEAAIEESKRAHEH
jgi:hypothetical protein